MGLDPWHVAACRAGADVIGEATGVAAEATGLARGHAGDRGHVRLHGGRRRAGLVRAGDAAEMTGQSTALPMCTDRPYLGEELIPLGHPVPGLHLVVGALVASGGALRWFRFS